MVESIRNKSGIKMKIDSHHHFWKYNVNDYSWITDEMKVLQKDFFPQDLLPELKQQGFDGSVAVQARQTLDETRWLLELAKRYSFIRGVVGWVDLCSDRLEQQLEEFAKEPKFIGVRHVVHDEPDDEFMARRDFQRGIGILAKYDLSYDLLIFPKHLSLAADLVSQFPGQRFVLDHLAKPNIRQQERATWERGFGLISQHGNVSCKLSGMVTEADWDGWKVDDFKYYLDAALKYFGPDRLMFGSDWPVCKLAGSYDRILALVENYLGSSELIIRDKIMGLNCQRIYNLARTSG